MASLEGRSAEQIFGSIDARKLHSSMTLFRRAAPDESVFRDVLDRYFDGRADPGTGQLLEGQLMEGRLPEEQPGGRGKSGGSEQADG